MSQTPEKPAPRATQRPGTFVKPAHWTNEPAPTPAQAEPSEDPEGLSPTRYGDFTRKGIAWDF
ncbi:MAG: DUF1674 domain-containing protein [Sphingomonadales bacterium]|nr:DUF1674 domain-containing protein [Sphingomonadales bacterium]MDE2168842.1 DUF1674 domain-containing protein [Sphingomonadales bacterium]